MRELIRSLKPRRDKRPHRPFSTPGGQPLYQQPRAQQLPKSVRCPGCGAQNTVAPGQSTSCDYCGTTLAYS
ncbi:hypothetical protein ACFTAO_36630 [Paenibacillus rhizoplanae]